MLTLAIDNYDVDSFAAIAGAFGSSELGYVVTPNADHIIRLHDDPAFRAAYQQARFVLFDSRFIAKLRRCLPVARLRCCPGSDLTRQLFDAIIRPDDAVVLIGGSEAETGSLRARYRLDGLRQYIPPMGFIKDAGSVERCLEFIEANSPFRFCFLAVGSPQSEFLAQMLQRRARARGLVVCIGASINFLTGAERRAPRWLQACGLEWLFRLLSDPRRLARRYLMRGPRIFPLLLRTRFAFRSGPGSQQELP